MRTMTKISHFWRVEGKQNQQNLMLGSGTCRETLRRHTLGIGGTWCALCVGGWVGSETLSLIKEC
jgi:hypothetical protein